MTAAALAVAPLEPGSTGLWSMAGRRFLSDRVGVTSALIVLVFLAVAVASGAGLIARDWAEETGISYAPPGFASAASEGRPGPMPMESSLSGVTPEDLGIADPIGEEIKDLTHSLAEAPVPAPRAQALPLGGDKWGRDVLKKTIRGTQTSVLVGLSAALVAAFIGTLFGAQAGYYGGKTDAFFNWLYSVFTSIPYLLLILAIAAVLNQKGTTTVVMILGLTGWTGIFRLVRAEYIKHKQREYVQAANAIGAGNLSRMYVHILPNVSHVVLVQLSLHVVLFIKSEVILSFLGFGVGVDTVSWGSMINESQNELLNGRWWQLASATAAMAVLVTAFSLLTDALRDALDPRLN
jgi:ABC-type dipeptide/oligopeptide/nickel transport system permease subunit